MSKEQSENIQVGDFVIDTDGHCCLVTDMSKNRSSIEIYHLKKTDNGINCKQWYYNDKNFFKRFKVGLGGYFEWLDKANYDQIRLYLKTKDEVINYSKRIQNHK